MRKIIVSQFITLDGIIEGPGPVDLFIHAGWTVPYTSKEISTYKAEELFAADALLLGRKTYDGFAAVWPLITEATAGGITLPKGFAARMNNIQKFVVTTLHSKLAWNNSTAINENVVGEIIKLKKQEGKDILVFGSSKLVQTLVTNNLIDEYRLLVYPVVLGTGKKLFQDGNHISLQLGETKTFDKGVVLLVYNKK